MDRHSQRGYATTPTGTKRAEKRGGWRTLFGGVSFQNLRQNSQNSSILHQSMDNWQNLRIWIRCIWIVTLAFADLISVRASLRSHKFKIKTYFNQTANHLQCPLKFVVCGNHHIMWIMMITTKICRRRLVLAHLSPKSCTILLTVQNRRKSLHGQKVGRYLQFNRYLFLLFIYFFIFSRVLIRWHGIWSQRSQTIGTWNSSQIFSTCTISIVCTSIEFLFIQKD